MGKKIKLSDLSDPEKLKKHQPELDSYFDKGGTWQELLGYDPDKMEDHYKTGYNLYQSAEFKKAGGVFSYLTMLNPYEYKYWMGLGLAKQSEHFFEEAIVAYIVAESVDPEEPLPHFSLAQCYYALQLFDETKDHLNKAVKVAKMTPEDQEIKRKATILLQNLPKL
ncbi:MAG: Chaperone protein IpgC [Chlamydiae bacterium]|nr:Chaperone protein IpgC [Chlamydiota bacterium]